MREAAYDKAFDLLEEIKDLGKKKRMALCELEDAMYECYEASKDKEEDSSEREETVSDMDYRKSRRMRYEHPEHEYDDDTYLHDYRRRGMRMRSRQGRYSY